MTSRRNQRRKTGWIRKKKLDNLFPKDICGLTWLHWQEIHQRRSPAWHHQNLLCARVVCPDVLKSSWRDTGSAWLCRWRHHSRYCRHPFQVRDSGKRSVHQHIALLIIDGEKGEKRHLSRFTPLVVWNHVADNLDCLLSRCYEPLVTARQPGTRVLAADFPFNSDDRTGVNNRVGISIQSNPRLLSRFIGAHFLHLLFVFFSLLGWHVVW